MKTYIDNAVPSPQLSLDQIANDFLRYVVVLYSETESADPARWEEAKRLCDETPAILDENIYVAAAAGDVNRIKQWLDKQPDLINKKGGHWNWEPLMYTAYSRLPGVSTFEAGKVLLKRGADPNAHYMWGGQYKFTALTGVFGQGEGGPENLLEHPEYEKFARLLLSAGANANDSQAAYNRMFTNDNTCLELLLEFGIAASDKNNWLLHENDKLISHPQETLHYQLCHAVRSGMMLRVKLLVEHDVDVNKKENNRTPYAIALLGAHQDVADYLLANGAEKVERNEIDVFRNTCLSADKDKANAMLAQNANLIEEVVDAYADILEKPIDAGRINALKLMIDLGFDVNKVSYRTALHQAAWHGRVDMIKLLIDAGADPKIRDTFYYAPALGWALHNKQTEAVAYLEDCDMDIFTAVARGKLDKIEALLFANPSMLEQTFSDVTANGQKPSANNWMTPLAFAAQAGQIDSVTLLLSKGADTGVHNGQGYSLLDLAHDTAGPAMVDFLKHHNKAT